MSKTLHHRLYSNAAATLLALLASSGIAAAQASPTPAAPPSAPCMRTTTPDAADAIVQTDRDPVVVPRLTSQPVLLARQRARLAQLNWVVGTFYIADRNWRADIRAEDVMMQAPQPGAEAYRGQTVGLWQFLRAEPDRKVVTTPDVKGLPSESACAKLREAGLEVMSGAPPPPRDPTKPLSPVVRDQYPRATQAVLAGTSVLLLIDEPEVPLK